jgi:hypothetical protein
MDSTSLDSTNFVKIFEKKTIKSNNTTKYNVNKNENITTIYTALTLH